MMRWKKSLLGSLGLWSLLGSLGLLSSLSFATPAEAFVVINEFLADPPAGLAGDANGDGIRSATDDEFVEILNYGTAAADLSGWSLSDAVATRHVFPSGTFLPPYDFLVVFGGLSLNNGGDTISLLDADLNTIDQIVYGAEGGQDQSLTRFPDGSGQDFFLHGSLPQAGGTLFSPGATVDGRPLRPVTVPEPPVWGCFVLGCGFLWAKFFVMQEETSKVF